MTLPAGSRFGPYEVVAQLGEGGMGEVYRAHDTRLTRDVALKVLHADVAQNADRRARFEREARAIAALNHPNILAIFDIGEENGLVYFVSELVEGESLRNHISLAPLPVRDVLDIALQIADGMAAAHSAGITHRDLKPENVMLTRDGRVKVLDFGLARQAQTAAQPDGRTLTMNETQPGAVMGTPNYMSPEQVRGGAVDYRSDQFSFGIILYEMATGKQAFQRETVVQTMSAVITDDPPAMDPAVQAKLPPPLRWVMERCLAKEPSRRYESTRDLYADLRAQRDHLSEAYSSGALPQMPAAKAPARGSFLWKTISAVLLLVTVALIIRLVKNREPRDSITNYRFTPFAVSSEGQTDPEWSPDGKAAAYLGRVDGTYQVFVRYFNAQVPVQLTTTGASEIYRWSPDSRRIFFLGWKPDEAGSRQAIFSVAAVGGEPELVMALAPMAADVSPDGKTLAVCKPDPDGFRRIYVSSPIGSPLQPYPSSKFANKSHRNVPRLRFSPDGTKLLFLYSDVEPKRWLLPYPAGEPKEVLSSLPHPNSTSTPALSWFPDSRHVVLELPAHPGEPSNLWIADTAGISFRRLTAAQSSQHQPAVSPDGQQILYRETMADYDIAKVGLTDGKVIRLIATQRDESMPAWAAEVGKFAYVTTRNGPPEIWMRNEDGADRPLVTPADFAPTDVSEFIVPTLSPDGNRVVYTMLSPMNSRLYISSTSGGAPTRVTNSTGSLAEIAGSLSPDGRQLAYVEIDSDKFRLMVVKTSGQATPSRIRENIDRSRLPQWSPTGEWITFADKAGWNLISPDGKTVRSLGKVDALHLAFSLDGKKLYGVRDEKDHAYLFSMDLTGGAMKTIADIGKDYAPRSPLNPGYRLSVAPDGTCAIYSIATMKSSIWLFEGFKP